MPRKTRRQLVGGKLEDLPIEDGRRSLAALSRELHRSWRTRGQTSSGSTARTGM